jgi:hypothetical protein
MTPPGRVVRGIRRAFYAHPDRPRADHARTLELDGPYTPLSADRQNAGPPALTLLHHRMAKLSPAMTMALPRSISSVTIAFVDSFPFEVNIVVSPART